MSINPDVSSNLDDSDSESILSAHQQQLLTDYYKSITADDKNNITPTNNETGDLEDYFNFITHQTQVEQEDSDNENDDNDDNDDDEKNEKYVNLMNVFLCWYKQVFDKEKPVTMFHDIDYKKEESTNRCMELFYNEMYKYNSNKDDDDKIAIYDPEDIDINKCEELYILTVDSINKAVCQCLMPLLIEVSKQDWLNINWSITAIKTS